MAAKRRRSEQNARHRWDSSSGFSLMKFVDWLESLTLTQFFSLCLLMSLISSFCFTATISPGEPLWQSIPLVRMYQNAVNVWEHGLENDFSFYGMTVWKGKDHDTKSARDRGETAPYNNKHTNIRITQTTLTLTNPQLVTTRRRERGHLPMN